jgi:hypothetical protein
VTLALRRANKLGYILYPLFLHESFDFFQDIKRGAGVNEARRAYLDGTGSRHDELDGIIARSDAPAADDG